jgi:hypothetical protein
MARPLRLDIADGWYHVINGGLEKRRFRRDPCCSSSVITHTAGIVHINRQSGHLFWEEENLDPVVKQYAKKYLLQEGFVEQALGVLDPEPHQVPDLFPDDILN